MTAIELRDMTIGDVGSVAAIEAEAIDVPWSVSSIASLIECERAVARVAVRDSEVVGYYRYYYVEDVADINNIAVLAGVRRQGVGNALIEDIIAQCSICGVSAINLEVREGNVAAVSLYEKHGFIKCGVRKKYYDNTSDAILYTKSS